MGTGGRTDQITGLTWSADNGTTYPWENAITLCATATTGGLSAGSWRLPTQMELLQAYIDGIWGQQLILSPPNYYWSSSAVSAILTNAWTVALTNGSSVGAGKGGYNRVICVR